MLPLTSSSFTKTLHILSINSPQTNAQLCFKRAKFGNLLTTLYHLQGTEIPRGEQQAHHTQNRLSSMEPNSWESSPSQHTPYREFIVNEGKNKHTCMMLGTLPNMLLSLCVSLSNISSSSLNLPLLQNGTTHLENITF